MAVKAGLKGGLIGGAVGLVLTLLGLIPVPFLPCVCCGLSWLGYIGAGVLAGFFLHHLLVLLGVRTEPDGGSEG